MRGALSVFVARLHDPQGLPSLSADGWLSSLLPALVMAVLAILSARLVISRGDGRAVRLAASPLLVGFLFLPLPAALLVGVAAALAGRGSGVAGGRSPGIRGFLAVAAALLACQLLALFRQELFAAEPFRILLWLTLLYASIQLPALGVGRLLSPPGGRIDRRAAAERRTLLVELINLPLAWIGLILLLERSWAAATALGGLVAVAQIGLIRFSRDERSLSRARHELALRITELDTLHAIGREILSSLDPLRVGRIIERECAKIFDVDSSFIALVGGDSSEMEIVYSNRSPGQTDARSPDGASELARQVSVTKLALRIDDTTQITEGRFLVGSKQMAARGIHSVVVVPLIVEDRVIGALSLQSAKRSAYDDHQLSVLTTIGQQAAVAIENAKHFQMATIDSLTGFFLRDYFFKRLDEEHKRASRYGGNFSLLMIDLDGFKSINDKHGHLAGDRYLRAISRTIRGELRAADLACRYGGDEFCLLLPETDFAGARTIAERIRKAVSREAVGVEGLSVRSTASIGLAAFPEHDSGAVNDLLRKADEALYRAKRAGRDCVVPFAA